MLSTLDFCPVQQPMRVEGVVYPGALLQVEREPEFRPSGANAFAIAGHLFGRRAIFLLDVLGDVLPFRRHLRIESFGLPTELRPAVTAYDSVEN